MDGDTPLATVGDLPKGTTIGPMDAKTELRAYASRLKADFERQKLSRAAGRHARDLEEGGYANGDTNGQDPKQPVMRHSLSQARSQKVAAVTLEWINLTYTVRVGKGKAASLKTILYAVSGRVRPGSLLAVMGPTGSGKTSLVNALAGRLPADAHGAQVGEVLVNGRERQKNFRRMTSYVMQDDVLLHCLTVRETFLVAAKLRLPGSVTAAEKVQVVEAVISELGLVKAANTKIGNSFVRGVSGGERKRCNIGVEMMSNPSLIFLDEPTSGLDAFQAQAVLQSLCSVAFHGRTVVTTIHQPRSSIYAMFDLLLLLSEGRTMFFGAASHATTYFGALGLECLPEYNPADFFLDVVSMDYRTPEAEAECRERVRLLAEVYFQSQGSQHDREPLSEKSLLAVESDFRFACSWVQQLSILMRRAWLQTSRDKLPLIVTGIQTIVIGVLLGLLYINMNKSYTGIQDRIGLLFFICIFTAFGNMLQVINTFPAERSIIFRERASKSYQVSAYFLAKLVAEQPLRILSTLIFSSIVYWMAGLNPSARAYFTFYAIVVCEALAASALGFVISAACKNEKVALALAPALTIIFVLFGGFYANTNTIPKALRWIEWISHLYWAFMAFCINEFQGACCWGCSGDTQPGCYLTGDYIIRNNLGFGGKHLFEPFLGLLVLIVLYNSIGYMALRFKKPKYLPLVLDSPAAAAVKLDK